MPALTRRAALGTLAGAAVLLAGCASRTPSPADGGPPPPSPERTPTPTPSPASAAEMADRATLPVLCYHQVRPWASGDSAYSRDVLVCPPESFREQLDAIVDAGYTTISPDDYLAHLRGERGLPARPVLLTFDDGKDNQPDTAFAELNERGLTGTLFVMTVVLGKKGWIARSQVGELARAGHTIGSHTWDHRRTTELTTPEQWAEQFVGSRQTLQELSGQAVESFAYPYGLWGPQVIPHLVEAGYTTAFQLTDKPVAATTPAHTLRRRMAVSRWSGEQVLSALGSFGDA